MRILRFIVVFAGACGLAAGLSHTLNPAGAPSSRALADGPGLRFASVTRGNIEQTVTVTGTLQPVKTIEVGSQLSGQLAKVYVDFNDNVRKDQPLAQIDPRTFAAKVDEAKSVLEVARANVDLEKAKLDRARIDLENVQANKDILAAKLESAEALKTSARRTLERKLALQSQNAVATTTVEDAQTDLTSKRAQEREAKVLASQNAYAVEGAQADVRRIEAELQQARTTVPEKEAVLRQAQADLDRTVIRSPIDGVVVGRFVNEGQTLAVGLESRTTFTVAHRLQDMEIHAQVDEADIGRIALGQRAHFTVDAYPDRRFEAVVRQVRKAPQSQQHVVTYTVVLSTSNLDGALLPGMTALVKVIVDHQDGVLTVPLAALRFQPAGASAHRAPREDGVWLRTASGSVRRVAVKVGSAGSEQVALESGGLAEGSQVAVGQAIRSTGRSWFGIRFGS